MRLIDADALVKEVLGMRYTEEAPSIIFTPAGQEIFNSGVEAASFAISDAPTIDAVPVVRCKDCQYAIPLDGHAFRRWGNDALNCTECRGDDGFGMAGVSLAYHDGFCDRGILRECEPHD